MPKTFREYLEWNLDGVKITPTRARFGATATPVLLTPEVIEQLARLD